MGVREDNYYILHENDYGIEELRGFIDLYNNKTNLFVGQFKNHMELSLWIKENLK